MIDKGPRPISVATPGLAEEFYIELRYFMTKAAAIWKNVQAVAVLG